MRASRLISILLLLQTRGRMTAQELAEELEVSIRTVYRDVESLGAAGVPLYADRGPAGGYQLLDGYRTRLTGLTSGEAESLFLAGIPGPAAELGLGTVLAGAQLKLLAALPPELRSRAGRIKERFHLDAPGWFHEGDESPHLSVVADAVWNQRALHVRYRRWGGEVDRTLDPLGLVLKAGVWYLVASVSGQIRTYRVSRILELETLNQHFERPEGFDLAGYWQTWAEQFQTRLYQAEAVVRLSSRAIELLPHFFSPEASRAAKASALPVDPDGWVQVVLPIESIEHAIHDLLRFGADAEVVAPQALRERMTGAADALARVYRNR
ncbi:helix-turn-helix transcriptional regulator [Nitrolancea hollandica]|uniref:Helix-turn-helix type 11 domain protein n=1 Tax=Nitrolancea hollandica Lb TaxID=1129897 RepID=I4ECR4_9BACT|nr:YafY family protein [Nitrolancea hollandica]CCF82476.1 Helix-turn-helix type 11 domain protein [Nitrolancea hollandica Lb]